MVDESRKFPAKGDQLLGAVYRDFLSRNRLLEYIEACDEMDYQNSLSSWLQFALKVVELFSENKALDIGRLKTVELLDKKLNDVLAEIMSRDEFQYQRIFQILKNSWFKISVILLRNLGLQRIK